MHFLSLLLRWLSATVLHGAIFFLLVAISFSLILADKQNIKNILAESGIYTSFVDSVIADNAEQLTTEQASVPFEDIQIQEIANRSFHPKLLQEQTHVVIDGAYDWLEGKNEALLFTMDFSAAKTQLTDELSTYAATRLQNLPNCTATDDISRTNVFELPCRPAGVSPVTVKEQVASDLQSTDLLQNLQLTQDDLPRFADNRSIDETLFYVPRIFQLMRYGIWIGAALVLLTATFFVLVRRPMRKAIRSLGRDLASFGAFLLIFTIFFSFVLPNFTDSFTIQTGGSMQATFTRLSELFMSRVDVIVINVSIQIVAIGIALLLVEKMSRPSSLYAALRKESGLVSSELKRKEAVVKPSQKQSKPPVQTSESVKKRPARPSKKFKKKIGL